jgi:hypothetical protein
MKKVFLIVLLLTYLQFADQQISYQALKEQALNISDEELTLDEDKTEKEEEKLISPNIVGNYWCDKDIKLNSVRQEVMTNKNYNK